MGYTHYWTLRSDIPEGLMADAVEDIAGVIRGEGEHICYELDQGDTPPLVSESLIRFNGKGDLGHETFYFDPNKEPSNYDEPGEVFSFCKTGMKPYDDAVTACLLLLQHHLGEYIQVSSDGNWEDWQRGRLLAEEIIGADAVEALCRHCKDCGDQIGLAHGDQCYACWKAEDN